MKHTRGPWFAVNYACFWNIQREDFYNDKDNLLDETICPDAEANAKLIAAAPDLLEALKKYTDSMIEKNQQEKWFKKYEDDANADRILITAFKAIKKATS